MAVNLELRRYQELIAQQARHSNTIAYLPTGTGKTLIACHLINHRLHEIRVRRELPEPHGGKVIVFIAPTKALVAQQMSYIKENCIQDIKAHQFNGESFFTDASTSLHVDLWTEKEWAVQFEKYEVLFMTPDCMRRLVEQSLIPSKLVDLIIFDECHHIVNKHPMAKLCDAMKAKPDMRPLIFGMTASPVNNKGGNIQKAIDQLEDRMMSTFFYPTPELISSLQTFTFKPRMLLLHYSEPPAPEANSTAEETDFSCFGLDSMSALQSQHFIRESLFELVNLRINRMLKLSKLFSAQLQLQNTPLNKYWYRQLHHVVNGGEEEAQEEKMLMIYPHLESIKEIINQTSLISKECGVYCALISFQYLLENSIPQRALADMYRQLQFQSDRQQRKLQMDKVMAPIPIEEKEDDDKEYEENTVQTEKFHEDGKVSFQDTTEVRVLSGVPGTIPVPLIRTETNRVSGEVEITSNSSNFLDLYYLREIDIVQLDRYYDELIPYYATKPLLFQKIQHQSLVVYISMIEMFYGLMEAIDPEVGFKALEAIKQYHQTSIDRQSAIDVYLAFLLEQVIEKAIHRIPLELYEDQLDMIPDLNVLTSSNKDDEDKEIHGISDFMMSESENENDIQIMLRFSKIVELIRGVIPIDGIVQKFLQTLPKDTTASVATTSEAGDELAPEPTPQKVAQIAIVPKITSEDMLNTGLISTKVDSFLDLIALLSNGLSNGDFVTTYSLFTNYKLFELNQTSFEIDNVSRGKFLKYFRDDLVDQKSSPNQVGIMNWVGNDRSLQEKGAAIVFCNMRVTAISLNKLIQEIKHYIEQVQTNAAKNFFIRSDVILGAQSASTQQRTLANMRNHECNLLFATDVAEEGLDIQRCNTIVHFDSPKRDIGFIQRRGRARSQFSLSFHLVADILDSGKDKKDNSNTSPTKPSTSSNADKSIVVKPPVTSMGKNSYQGSMIPSVSDEIRDLATFIKQEEETNRVMKTYLENLGVFLFSSQVEKLQLAERYVVESSGAYVDTTSAITLVDIYCENITYDVLSPVLPYYVYQVEEEDEDAQDGGSIIPTNASTAATTSALTLSNKSTNNNNHHHHNNKARGGMTVIGPQGNNQRSAFSSTTTSHYNSTTGQIQSTAYQQTQQVRCTLYIPASINGVPIPPMTVVSSQKRLAKGLAALKCVAYLHGTLQQLDDHLRIFPKRKKYQRHLKPSTMVNANGQIVPKEIEENLMAVSIKTVANVLMAPKQDDDDEMDSGDELDDDMHHQKTSKQVYLYRVYVGNHHEMTFTNIKEQKKVEALNSIAFALLQPLPEDILTASYPLTLHHLTMRFVFMETRVVTSEELLYMQVFHRAITHFQGLHCQLPRPNDTAPFLFPHYDQMDDLFTFPTQAMSDEEWTKSSQGTWYIMISLQQSIDLNGGFDFHFDVEYIKKAALECSVLLHNLNMIGLRNGAMIRGGHLHSYGQSNPFTSLDDLQDMIFTTDGRNMMILSEPVPEHLMPTLKLWDNMPGSKVAFSTQYSKKSEAIKTLVEQMVQTGQANEVKGEAIDDDVILKTAYMISGKLTLLNILLSESGLQVNPNNNPSNEGEQPNGHIHGTLAHIIPQICTPIGRSCWYYMAFLCPGVFFRLESCCLAYELRCKLDSGLFTPPPIPLLLQGITPRRTHENINSERLEFLGDSFLKYAVSATMFLRLPDASEEQLTIERTRLINNHFLTKTALKFQDSMQHVAQYMRILPISTGLEELHYTFPGLIEVNKTSAEQESDALVTYYPKLRNENIQLRRKAEDLEKLKTGKKAGNTAVKATENKPIATDTSKSNDNVKDATDGQSMEVVLSTTEVTTTATSSSADDSIFVSSVEVAAAELSKPVATSMTIIPPSDDEDSDHETHNLSQDASNKQRKLAPATPPPLANTASNAFGYSMPNWSPLPQQTPSQVSLVAQGSLNASAVPFKVPQFPMSASHLSSDAKVFVPFQPSSVPQPPQSRSFVPQQQQQQQQQQIAMSHAQQGFAPQHNNQQLQYNQYQPPMPRPMSPPRHVRFQQSSQQFPNYYNNSQFNNYPNHQSNNMQYQPMHQTQYGHQQSARFNNQQQPPPQNGMYPMQASNSFNGPYLQQHQSQHQYQHLQQPSQRQTQPTSFPTMQHAPSWQQQQRTPSSPYTPQPPQHVAYQPLLANVPMEPLKQAMQVVQAQASFVQTSTIANVPTPVSSQEVTNTKADEKAKEVPAKEEHLLAEEVQKQNERKVNADRSNSFDSTTSNTSRVSKESLVCMTNYYKTIQIPSKVMADMMEAMLGVYLLGSSEKAALKLLHTIHVFSDKVFIPNMAEAVAGYLQAKGNMIRTLPFQNAQEIQEILGYEFTHPQLLSLAFTHSSYQRDMNYQRLEYLGDAILDYLVVEDVYLRYPKADEGLMSRLKSTQTCNRRFSEITNKLGLMKYIMSASVTLDQLLAAHRKNEKKQQLQQQLALDQAGDPFITQITKQEVKEEVAKEDNESDEEDKDKIAVAEEVEEAIKKPEDEEEDAYSKITADIFESIIGAIYIDSYANVTVVREVARKLGAFETQIDIEED